MRLKYVFLCLSIGLYASFTLAQAPADKPGPIGNFPVIDGDMMNRYLLDHVAEQSRCWQDRYEQLITPEQIVNYQKQLRGKFIDAIGGLPERTPLQPQVTGIVKRNGYRVEKVIFQSQRDFYVTGAMFVPEGDNYKPPYPGVLICCGHDVVAKLNDEYQTMGALLALNGMAALVFDPIDQGERGQSLEHWPGLNSVYGHTMVGVGSILLGQNTARFEIWDAMRAIDYLQSREDIMPDRIGVTGHSGGGTQTSYLMSLDDRIKAAAPSCYITSYDLLLPTAGPQDAEQNIYGQLAFGMHHADYVMMRAPMPVLICAATRDFFDIRGTWKSFRYAKRLFTKLGFAERIDLIEHDAEHSYQRPHREAVARWMSRWLLGKDVPITEPAIELLSEEEMRCTPDGQVMRIAGAKSAYDLNRGTEKQFAEHRKNLWAKGDKTDLLNQVRKLAGIRTLAKLPSPKVREIETIKKEGYSIRTIVMEPEEGIYLPSLLFIPADCKDENPTLYVHEKGTAADAEGPIVDLVMAGKVVLAVDVRGTGQTQQTQPSWTGDLFGVDGPDVYLAYLLGKSYVGMRAEDILVCARWLRETMPDGKNRCVNLVSIGNVGAAALHAAALELELFGSVKLTGALVSWANLIESGQSHNQLINTVHGALTTYDLDNLAGMAGDKLTFESPIDALGRPL